MEPIALVLSICTVGLSPSPGQSSRSSYLSEFGRARSVRSGKGGGVGRVDGNSSIMLVRD